MGSEGINEYDSYILKKMTSGDKQISPELLGTNITEQEAAAQRKIIGRLNAIRKKAENVKKDATKYNSNKFRKYIISLDEIQKKATILNNPNLESTKDLNNLNKEINTIKNCINKEKKPN